MYTVSEKYQVGFEPESSNQTTLSFLLSVYGSYHLQGRHGYTSNNSRCSVDASVLLCAFAL